MRATLDAEAAANRASFRVASKQNFYPVLFLIVGVSKRYTPFTDLRSANTTVAVNFGVSANLIGINFHSEELLINKQPVEKAKSSGLVAFVWGQSTSADDRRRRRRAAIAGDDLDRTANVDYFRHNLKVDGMWYKTTRRS